MSESKNELIVTQVWWTENSISMSGIIKWYATQWYNNLWNQWFDYFYSWVKNLLAKWLLEKDCGDESADWHDMDKIKMAYQIAKNAHRWQMRSNWKRLFEHLRRVWRLILDIFPNPSVNDIIIAILHDILEDTDIKYETLKNIFWEFIANTVFSLSKKNLASYVNLLNENEKKLFEEYLRSIWKITLYKEWKHKELEKIIKNSKEISKIRNKLVKIRNREFFSNIENLNDSWLKVKFCDRIDNLKNTKWCEIWLIKRKIKETEKFFFFKIENSRLDERKKIVEIWQNLLRIEIVKLKEIYNIK